MSELGVQSDEMVIAEVQKILADYPLPPELQDIRIELGHDSTGDPGVWLHFNLKAGVDPSDETITRLSRFMYQVKDTLWRRNLSRFIYSYLEETAAA